MRESKYSSDSLLFYSITWDFGEYGIVDVAHEPCSYKTLLPLLSSHQRLE